MSPTAQCPHSLLKASGLLAMCTAALMVHSALSFSLVQVRGDERSRCNGVGAELWWARLMRTGKPKWMSLSYERRL